MSVNGKDKADIFNEYFDTKPIIIDDCNVANCMYFNDKNKKCRTFSYGDGVKFTSYKCEQDKNCYFKQLQRLKKKNEELKYEIDRQKDTILYLQNYDICHKTLIEYKQALEEIKKETHRLFYELNPIYGYNNSNHFEFLAKFVMKKTDEVLNEK